MDAFESIIAASYAEGEAESAAKIAVAVYAAEVSYGDLHVRRDALRRAHDLLGVEAL